MKEFWFGFICILVLITTTGYLNTHAARTGDYDALFTFFLTLGCFAFFFFMENSQKKYLYLFFISLALAALTKGVAALMILPGIFIYVLIKKKLLFLLKNKDFYVGFLLFLALVGGYYGLREIYNPGYLMVVWKNELGGRFLEAAEGHNDSFWFYFDNLITLRFKEWIFLIPLGIFLGMISKNTQIKNLTLFSTVIAITFLLVISAAKTKLNWYALPAYPFLSILVGVFIYIVFLFIKEKKRFFKYNIVAYVFVLLIFITPYIRVLKRTNNYREFYGDYYRISYYLRDIIKGEKQGDNFLVVYNDYAPHIRFYINILNEKGKNISFKEKEKLEAGEIILCSQDEVKEYIKENYEYKISEEYYNIAICEIIDRK